MSSKKGKGGGGSAKPAAKGGDKAAKAAAAKQAMLEAELAAALAIKTRLSDPEDKRNVKRNRLLEIQVEMQKKWDAAKCFEVDAPPNGKEKADESYFVTFPYPYMNGKLHLGHSFTLSKCEFAVGYQRMKGKKCLWPMGFHCTGMPIKTAADKLKREIQQYGDPAKPNARPNFPAVVAEGEGGEQLKHKKLQAKSAGKNFQWETMEAMDIPENEIAQFAEGDAWLKYFPPLAIADLKGIGFKIDFRRSFITTPANQFYDSFVKWQFIHLKEKDKIRFGKRYTVYSPRDGQPCMAHDRSKGENEGPQEYAVVKMKVLDPKPPSLAALGDKNVFLVAATLRPETMYGQTNCWVSPTITYVAYAINDTDVFVSTIRAAKNMAHQCYDEYADNGIKGYTREFGVIDKLCDVPGMELMGCKLSAPNAQYEVVYALPLMTIKENKGTGIVTCVPSDSPDDWAGLRDLQKKAALREKFNITDEMVLPFAPVPIIDIPDYGDLCAIKACEDLKIVSQNDTLKLAEAKEICYQKGFYTGKLKVGKHAGKSVEEAKELCRADMFNEGTAVKYFEPEKYIESRSGEECVIGLCDQWYLVYGEPEWRAQVEKHVENNLEVFDPLTKKKFMMTLDWLHEHACSRQYGLGSRLPWDEEWLIESLSDSTIYMAYYAVAGLLHEGTLDGSGGGSLGITPDQLTREAWDYIFLGLPVSEACTIAKESLDKMRNEFLYLYPMDLRVSGKDLVPNHLTYCLYNHAAIFPEELWPRAIRANGHIMLNNDKMSKSTGNFLTLEQGTALFSADVTRMCFADAGDSLEDANFEFKVADTMIVTLFNELEWSEEMIKGLNGLRCGPISSFIDRAFMSAINLAVKNTDAHYKAMMYREARKSGFAVLRAARNTYREMAVATGEGMHRDIVAHYVGVQWLLMAPFTPHLSEYVWGLLHNDEGLIMNAEFPKSGPVDKALCDASEYLDHIVHRFRVRKETLMKPKKGKVPEPPTLATIYVAAEYPEWQKVTLDYLKSVYDSGTNSFPDARQLLPEMKQLPGMEDKKIFKGVMPFIAWVRDAVDAKGKAALETFLEYDEMQTVTENLPYLCKALDMKVVVRPVSEADGHKAVEGCKPADPAVMFTSN